MSQKFLHYWLTFILCFQSFFTFRETYIEQEQGENANDRNDRAIRVAAKWYNEHLKMSAENQLQVILITNDKKNKEKAAEEGIPAFTCRSECRCFCVCLH